MANPLCPYFWECGGCSSQHIDYDIQIESKKKLLAMAIGYSDIKAFSGSEYGYRNRMDFVFTPTGVGLRKKGKWDRTVDVERCVIANEKLNLMLGEVRNFFTKPDYFDLRKHSGTFRYAVIRTPQNSASVSFVLNGDSMKIKDAVEKIEEFSKITSADNVVVTYVGANTDNSVSDDFFVVKGEDMLKEQFLGKTFYYSVQGFFQNNSIMAEKMQEHCNAMLKNYSTKDSYLLDLYGGVGTFGIINAGLFREVTIVENSRQCIDAANRNKELNNVKNAKAIALDAAKIGRLTFGKPLFVVTDPPRSGMHPKTIQFLNELRPELIIYVSCNIEQLGKDLAKFKGYSVKSAALFDLFPQTPHVESIVELAPKR